MRHLDDAIARLETKTTAAFEAEKAERQRKWALIQEKSPELAADLLAITEAFGKPKRVWVEIEGERIL